MFLESRGEGERQVALKWNEYASGAYIKGVRFPEDRAKADRSGRARVHRTKQAPVEVLPVRIRRRIGAVEYTVGPERVPPMWMAISNLAAEWSSKESASVTTEEVNISN